MLFKADFAYQFMVAKLELNNLKLIVNFCVDYENKTDSETSSVNLKLVLITFKEFIM